MNDAALEDATRRGQRSRSFIGIAVSARTLARIALALITVGMVLVGLSAPQAKAQAIDCPVQIPPVRAGEVFSIPSTALVPGSIVAVRGGISIDVAVPADGSNTQLTIPAELAPGTYAVTITTVLVVGLPITAACSITVEAATASAPPPSPAAAPQSPAAAPPLNAAAAPATTRAVARSAVPALQVPSLTPFSSKGAPTLSRSLAATGPRTNGAVIAGVVWCLAAGLACMNLSMGLRPTKR